MISIWKKRRERKRKILTDLKIWREKLREKQNKTDKTKRTWKQVGGWLNRHNFAYPDCDSVNMSLTAFKKMVPGLIKNAANQVDWATEREIQQAVQQGRKEIERIAPKIIRQAIEEVCKTPFCLLGNIGRKKIII